MRVPERGREPVGKDRSEPAPISARVAWGKFLDASYPRLVTLPPHRIDARVLIGHTNFPATICTDRKDGPYTFRGCVGTGGRHWSHASQRRNQIPGGYSFFGVARWSCAADSDRSGQSLAFTETRGAVGRTEN